MRQQPRFTIIPGMFSIPGKLGVVAAVAGRLRPALALLLGFSCLPAYACPDLTPYYPGADPDWPALVEQLARIQGECLDNAEYFALLGAAQLNSSRSAEAMESLERALLLDPDQGAAQIDYAQVLFVQGQLFSALEMNRAILARADLPVNLEPALLQRQQEWESLTRQLSWQADALLGYDSNLNGAPDPSQITLTLSGESVILTLNPEYRPVSGPYTNLRVEGHFRQLAAEHQHNLLFGLRGRVSEDQESDLLQLDSRYAFVKPGRESSWQVDGGLSHLFFGGSALYTAAESRLHFLPDTRLPCRPSYGLALQYQHYHEQNQLNAAESKVSAGLSCPYEGPLGSQLVSVEAGWLGNAALQSGRPGGHRRGWQVNLDWQILLPRGELHSQLNFTRLADDEGYNPLLSGGDDRWLDRGYALIQYRQPVTPQLTFLANLYHQVQKSNIELFRTRDSTFEVGLSLSF